MRAMSDAIVLKRKGKTLYAVKSHITSNSGAISYNIYQPMKRNKDEWEYIYTESQVFIDKWRVSGEPE